MWRPGVVAAALLTVSATAAWARCPAAEVTVQRLASLGLERASRTARFSVPVPEALYARAAREVGRVESSRDGDHGVAVAIVALPLESLWRAVNDEGEHAVGDYLLVNRSEIVAGTPRGLERTVFQAGSRMGLGRWWVTRTRMNADLFGASGGMLWEVTWDGREQPEAPPVRDPPDLSPVRSTEGAWLLARVDHGCTLVEHFSRSDPGGFVGVMQGLVLGRALRDAVAGMVDLAAARYLEPPSGPPFVRPDGDPLD